MSVIRCFRQWRQGTSLCATFDSLKPSSGSGAARILQTSKTCCDPVTAEISLDCVFTFGELRKSPGLKNITSIGSETQAYFILQIEILVEMDDYARTRRSPFVGIPSMSYR